MRDAGGFGRRLLASQALVLLGAALAIGLLAPRLLFLGDEVRGRVLTSGAAALAIALALTTAAAWRKLRFHRFLLRALAMGSQGLDTEDIGGLAELAGSLTLRFWLSSALVAVAWMLPGLRPALLDEGRALSLALLCVTILGAAAIPFYVLARASTTRLVETAPVSAITQVLEQTEPSGKPELRVRRKLLLATLAPVALVGTGAVLVAHAHLRNLAESARRETAVLVARASLEPTPGALSEAGRDEAAERATELGFETRVLRGQAASAPAFHREKGGDITALVPLEDGLARVRVSPEIHPGATGAGVAVAILAVLLSALLGGWFGRALGHDLADATARLRRLGTEKVLRGGAEIARPARFDAVRELGRAVELVAERFRVFAAAQERAIEAREAARRMRGLLFASVSHDLKSPLNAILGFADLVAEEPLAPEQRESLDLIRSRGRELLALIETILDAARIEAGQLTLAARPVRVEVLLEEARRKATELAPGVEVPVSVDCDGDVPSVPIDPTYGTRALAVVLAYGMRLAAAAPSRPELRVRACVPAEAERARLGAPERARAPVLVEVRMGGATVSSAELEALFARQSTSRGKGLTLGLSLARSVIELHGGKVSVSEGDAGAPVVRFWLALALPARKPRLSSRPALGPFEGP